jgi:hypothetical protein
MKKGGQFLDLEGKLSEIEETCSDALELGTGESGLRSWPRKAKVRDMKSVEPCDRSV